MITYMHPHASLTQLTHTTKHDFIFPSPSPTHTPTHPHARLLAHTLTLGEGLLAAGLPGLAAPALPAAAIAVFTDRPGGALAATGESGESGSDMAAECQGAAEASGRGGSQSGKTRSTSRRRGGLSVLVFFVRVWRLLRL